MDLSIAAQADGWRVLVPSIAVMDLIFTSVRTGFALYVIQSILTNPYAIIVFLPLILVICLELPQFYGGIKLFQSGMLYSGKITFNKAFNLSYIWALATGAWIISWLVAGGWDSIVSANIKNPHHDILPSILQIFPQYVNPILGSRFFFLAVVQIFVIFIKNKVQTQVQPVPAVVTEQVLPTNNLNGQGLVSPAQGQTTVQVAAVTEAQLLDFWRILVRGIVEIDMIFTAVRIVSLLYCLVAFALHAGINVLYIIPFLGVETAQMCGAYKLRELDRPIFEISSIWAWVTAAWFLCSLIPIAASGGLASPFGPLIIPVWAFRIVIVVTAAVLIMYVKTKPQTVGQPVPVSAPAVEVAQVIPSSGTTSTQSLMTDASTDVEAQKE